MLVVPPFKRQPHKMVKRTQAVKELFECVWLFCGLKWLRKSDSDKNVAKFLSIANFLVFFQALYYYGRINSYEFDVWKVWIPFRKCKVQMF